MSLFAPSVKGDGAASADDSELFSSVSISRSAVPSLTESTQVVFRDRNMVKLMRMRATDEMQWA